MDRDHIIRTLLSALESEARICARHMSRLGYSPEDASQQTAAAIKIAREYVASTQEHQALEAAE